MMMNSRAAHNRVTGTLLSCARSRLVLTSLSNTRRASTYHHLDTSLTSVRPHGARTPSPPTCRLTPLPVAGVTPMSTSSVAWRQSTRSFSIIGRRLRENTPGDGNDKKTSRPPAQASESTTATTSAAAVKKAFQKVLPLASLTPHENIYTVPNMLTFSRLIVAPVIGYAILHDAHVWALGLFAYAGFSDLLDGWIARKWNLQTVVGSVVDPMADKLLMTILTVCLATQGSLPVWLAVIILGRDVGLAISAIYYRYISLPPPKTFMRYWDFSLPSAEVHPTTISKYNTFLQLGLMGATMTAPVVALDVSTAMTGLQYLVATTTVWSGLSYVYSKDAVKILSQEDAQRKEEEMKK